MVRHGVENMAHQRFVPSWNPNSSRIYKIYMGISVSSVERDCGPLHQAFGVQGRVACTIDAFSLVGAGRNLRQERGGVSDAGSLGAGRCTVGSTICCGLGREGAGGCSGASNRDGNADPAERFWFASFPRL